MKVRVYKNLHKDCYSVKSMEGVSKGLVIAHCDNIVLKNVKYIMSERGRQRVLSTRQKNVHAYLEGEILSIVPRVDSNFRLPIYSELPFSEVLSVTYNPYKYESFVYKENETPIHISDYAILNENGIHVPRCICEKYNNS